MLKRIELEKQGKPAEEITELILDNCHSTVIEGLDNSFMKLETLSLNNVGLKSIKNFPKLISLTTLVLSDNKISDSLDELIKCRKISTLNLSGTNIKTLAEISPLHELRYLRSLDVTNSPITKVPDYRQKIFTMIPHIRYIDGVSINNESEDGNMNGDEISNSEYDDSDCQDSDIVDSELNDPNLITKSFSVPQHDDDDDEYEDETEEEDDEEDGIRVLMGDNIDTDENDQKFEPNDEESNSNDNQYQGMYDDNVEQVEDFDEEDDDDDEDDSEEDNDVDNLATKDNTKIINNYLNVNESSDEYESDEDDDDESEDDGHEKSALAHLYTNVYNQEDISKDNDYEDDSVGSEDSKEEIEQNAGLKRTYEEFEQDE
ncbi:Acidic leucine-rich nuclear phosphoprotein 32 family member A [Intoshia linei]|uniref:Acidic leucine-rich nuclear phosphoprotein 32 family member A n=1 Tax=Intoshia linei TaxID=1819745 RepID=A0A177B021_9BILA|nr:Acidic leucine-rich nuclear phosphoprotein 32 family member A [Intoshia linei]